MFYISKEELEELYFNKNLTFFEIEEKLNIKRGRIYHWFKKYNIKVVKFYISKEELEDLYFGRKMSYSEIEEKLNIKRGRIYHWFKKYNIKPRNQSENMIGRKFTKEHKEKIAKSNSKPHTEERKKNISKSHKGKKMSEETKDKIRKAFIGLRVGSNHPLWKGGSSIMRNRLRQTFEYKNWRDMIYKRDHYICQMCFIKDKTLNAHHIKTFYSIAKEYCLSEYDDFINCSFLWDIDNGITLCELCHHSIKNKEEEYEEKFKNIIYEKKKIN